MTVAEDSTQAEPSAQPTQAGGSLAGQARRGGVEWSSERFAGIDQLRGLAVALMVVDHALAVMQTGSLVRATVTRLAMPLFVLILGGLITPSRLPRWSLWGMAAGLWAALDMMVIGLPGPFFLLALLAIRYAVHAALLCRVPAWVIAAAGATFAAQAPAGPFVGYNVGALVALVAIGTSLHPVVLNEWGEPLPKVLRYLGRFPLAVYVGHLFLLAEVVMYVEG